MLTKEGFIKFYAERSGLDVKVVLERMKPELCDCGDITCKGWRMVELQGRHMPPKLPDSDPAVDYRRIEFRLACTPSSYPSHWSIVFSNNGKLFAGHAVSATEAIKLLAFALKEKAKLNGADDYLAFVIKALEEVV